MTRRFFFSRPLRLGGEILDCLQEFQHPAIKLCWLFHIQHMRGVRNHNFPRAINAGFQEVGNLQDAAHVFIANNDEGGHMNLCESRNRGRFNGWGRSPSGSAKVCIVISCIRSRTVGLT